MSKLDVTDAMVRVLTDEMSPQVEQITGWDLKASSMRIRVLPRDRGYEEILLGRLRGAGVPIEVDGARTVLERLVEYVVENVILAAYEPSTQELYVVRENVDDSNLDGLRLVLAHELVHRGQHVNHGEMFRRVDQVARELFQIILEGGGMSRALQKMKEGQEVMTLLESHAHFVQDVLRASRFPGASIESHFSLPAVLMRIFGKAKLSQYEQAVPAVAGAATSGTIDALYESLLRRS